jgi:hypothetical protein
MFSISSLRIQENDDDLGTPAMLEEMINQMHKKHMMMKIENINDEKMRKKTVKKKLDFVYMSAEKNLPKLTHVMEMQQKIQTLDEKAKLIID